MAITPLPEPPSRGDSANFAQRGDGFMAALPPFAIQANDLAADVTAKQGTASAAATTATEQASIATTKAGQAGAAAASALDSKDAAALYEAAALAHKNAAGTSASNASGSEAAAAASAASVDAKGFATDYAGPEEPPVMWPFMTWADTGNMLLKRRNAAGTAWVMLGPLLEEMAAKNDLTPLTDLQWLGTPIGGVIVLRDDLTGVVAPPTNHPDYRYIKLTAGDPYNAGALTGETVSGAAPLIIATATIALAGSPMNGRAINLINTERRFFRSGASGVLQDDSIQNFTGQLSSYSTVPWQAASGAFAIGGASGDRAGGTSTSTPGTTLTFDPSRVARTSTETRVRNIGATYYMRVK